MNKLKEKFKDKKLKVSLITWIFVISSITLLMPGSISNQLEIASLIVMFKRYILIIAFISGFFLFKHLIVILFNICVAKIEARQKINSRVEMLKCLDFEEKAVLREFVIQKKNVLSLPLTEPAVANLLSTGVLEPAFETQEIKGSARRIKLSISIAVRQKLTYIVLGLPVGALTDEQAKNIKSARPNYARHNYIPLRD